VHKDESGNNSESSD